MKKTIFALALSGLLLMGIAFIVERMTFSKRDDQAASLFISKLMQAYNLPQAPGALTAIVTEARKANYYSTDLQDKMPAPFDQQMTLCFNGTEFRREKRFSQGYAQQTDLFDGQAAYRSEIKDGEPAGPARQLEEWEFQDVKFNVLTFGILPLMKQLQGSVEAVYIAGAGGGQEKLEVKIASITWTLYVDEQHLIQKVEMVHRGHFLVIEYGDYRKIGDVILPFSQRLYADGEPKYELVFTRFDLSPSFPPGYFTRDAL